MEIGTGQTDTAEIADYTVGNGTKGHLRKQPYIQENQRGKQVERLAETPGES